MPKIRILGGRGSSGSGLVAREPWVVDLDAGDLLEAVADAVKEEAQDAIRRGEHGSVEGRPRGLRTGKLLNSIGYRSGGSDSSPRATATVKSSARDRQDFLRAEAERGRHYISLDRASKRVDAAVRRWLDKVFD